MKHLNIKIVLTGIMLVIASALMQSCSTDVGGNEDKTSPVVSAISISDKDDSDGEIIGTATIVWTTDELNKSTVNILLSSDSGETFGTTIAANVPDTGEYVLDTNTVSDCRRCRLQIVATDVVGNTGDPVETTADFIINNVPQVLGAAIYKDKDNDGFGDGDVITIPFDKEVDLRSSVASDVFFLPVAGDNMGPFSTMSIGNSVNEVEITINDVVPTNYHFHIAGTFDSNKTGRTAPSGLDILENLSGDIIFSIETGRAGEPLGDGIDIASTFGEVIPSPLTAASSTVAVAAADLDDDDDIDIVRINTSGDNAILLNNGPAAWLDDATNTSNNFTTSQALGNATNTSVAVADIDGANGPDIVIGNSATNLVFLNNGSGSYAAQAQPVSFTSVAGTQAVALADVDNMNGVDVIVGLDGANQVLLNNGAGSFTDSGQLLAGGDTASVAMADIDNDGDQDMVTGNNGANRIWINNINNAMGQAGVFTDSGQALGSGDTRAVVLADIDSDSDLDLLTGNTNGANRVWRNDGKGNFSEDAVAQTLGTSDTETLVAVDADNDGDTDIVSGNRNQPDRVWFNDGAGVFIDSGQQLITINSLSAAASNIALGDFDGDTDTDLVVASTGGSSIDTIWLNSLRTPLLPYFIDSNQALGSNTSHAIAHGDVNGDGFEDVVTGNNAEPNRVYLSDKRGVFTDTGQELGNAATTSIALADVDGDGDLDIIAGNGSSQANQVWINSGINTGMFAPGNQFGSSFTTSIAIGNIDNDNDVDIIAGNILGDNIIWRNSGTGVFNIADMSSLADGDNTNSVVLADVDGDMDLDIITGNLAADNRVYLNGGDATW